MEFFSTFLLLRDFFTKNESFTDKRCYHDFFLLIKPENSKVITPSMQEKNPLMQVYRSRKYKPIDIEI